MSTRTSPGNHTGLVSDQYQVGKVPSGGYVTALALHCVTTELIQASQEPPSSTSNLSRPPNGNHTDVLTSNVHFMASTLPGTFTCQVEILKSGKTTSTVQASVHQQGKETMRVLATCGNLTTAAAHGPNLSQLCQGSRPPALPPIESCVRVDAGDNTPASVRSRVHLVVPPHSAAQYKGSRATRGDGSFDEATLLEREQAVKNKGATSEYCGYMYFSDGTLPQLCTAPIFLDAGVPPVLGVYVTGWVPSINWTVQFFCHPTATAPLRFRFKTSRVTGGFLEEDGELWDANGNLVAVSRQLAMVGVSQASKGKL